MIVKVKMIYVIALIAVLSGCKMVGTDYARHQLDVPSSFSEAEMANVNELKISNTWWTLFKDDFLNNMMTKALQNNSNLMVAVARIEEAQAYAQEVGAATLPQVNLDVNVSQNRVTEAGSFPVFAANPRSDYRFGFGTSFEIDFWGKLKRSKEAARAQLLATTYAKDTVALSLTTSVTNYYLLIRSLDLQLALSKESLKSRNESLALTKRRLAGGLVSALDVHQAEVASYQLTAQIVDLVRQRSLAEHQLGVLTGELNIKVVEGNLGRLPMISAPPAGLPSSLLENRPDVRQGEQNLIAANAKIGVAKAALFPTISLTGNVGGESLELSDILKSAARIWSFGVDLYLPVFDSDRRDAKINQVTAQQKLALASYSATIATAFREVNDALTNVRQQSEREMTLEKAQVAAKNTLNIAENRYKSGYVGYIDVLDAQRVYNETALTVVLSHQAKLNGLVDLFKALGGGWKHDLIVENFH